MALNTYAKEQIIYDIKKHEQMREALSNNDFETLFDLCYSIGGYYTKPNTMCGFLMENNINVLKHLNVLKWDNLFTFCDINSLNIPRNIVEITDFKTFISLNSSIKTVSFANSVINSLPNNCFYGDSSLESVVLPKNLTAIPSGMFYDCANLKDVFLPDSIRYIGKNAFGNCDNVKITANYRTISKIRAPKQDLEFLKQHLSFIHNDNENDFEEDENE